jgi:tetratricopeptide (TPR) repeat protein
VLRKAQRSCEQAVSDLRLLLADNKAEAVVAAELGKAYACLGQIQVERNDLPGAAQVYAEAARLFDDLSRRHPDTVEYRQLLGVALNNQGLSQHREGSHAAARVTLERGRKLLEDLVKGFSDVPTYRQDLARLLTNQALVLKATRQPQAAQAALEEAARNLEEAVRLFPRRETLKPALLAVYSNLIKGHTEEAKVYEAQGDWAKVEPHLRAVVGLRRKSAELLRPLDERASWQARLVRAGQVLVARAELVGTLHSHCRVLEEVGDHRGAAAVVPEVQKLVAPTWPGFLKVARILCDCILLAEKDSRLNKEMQEQAITRYGKRALQLLGPLVGQVHDLAEELSGPHFQPLRARRQFREEYQQLLTKAKSTR